MNKIFKRINLDTLKEFLQGEIPGHNSWDCLMFYVLGRKLPYENEIEKQGFNWLYSNGVIEGYDNIKYDYRSIDRNDLKYKLGHADGAAARKLLLET